MVIRDNRLKAMFREGRTAIGITPPAMSPDAVEVVGLLGFDYVFLDGEHCALGLETCQDLVRAAQAVDIEPLVRIPRNDPGLILGYLETGAWTLMVPHVNTAEEARNILAASKYAPLGHRGNAPPYTRASGYGVRTTQAGSFAYANEQTLTIPLIEEPEAVDNIEEIVRVPGLEAIMIGSGDLSLAMGYPGQHEHPAVLAAVDRCFKAARDAGVAAGRLFGFTPAATNSYIADGYGFLLGSGLMFFTTSANAFLSTLDRAPRKQVVSA